jgi:hypothetical protein
MFGGYGKSNLLVDRMGLDPGWRTLGAAARPGARLVILVDEKSSAAGSVAANRGAGQRGQSAGVISPTSGAM